MQRFSLAPAFLQCLVQRFRRQPAGAHVGQGVVGLLPGDQHPPVRPDRLACDPAAVPQPGPQAGHADRPDGGHAEQPEQDPEQPLEHRGVVGLPLGPVLQDLVLGDRGVRRTTG